MEVGSYSSKLNEDSASSLRMKSEANVSAPVGALEAANGHYTANDGPYTADDKPIGQEVHKLKPIKFQLGKRLQLLNTEKKCKEYNNMLKKNKISVNETNNIISKKRNLYSSNLINENDSKQLSNDLDLSTDNGHNKDKYNSAAIKKRKQEKGSQLKEYAQYLGLQPTVKFKCRKCCTMSFKSLGMLKEHQRICKWRAGGSTAAGGEGVDSPCRLTRKVYLCSACGTYYENWNLFLHMREVHDRHICLFCLGMFSKCDKLIAHLVSKHNVKEHRYNDSKDFYSVYSGSLFMMCCQCSKIYTEKDNFTNHSCGVPKPKLVLSRVAKSIKQVKNSTEKTDSVNNSQVSVPARMPDSGQLSTCTESEITPLPQTDLSSTCLAKTSDKQVVIKSNTPIIPLLTDTANMTIVESKNEEPTPELLEPESHNLPSPKSLEPIDRTVIPNNVEHWRNENNNTLLSDTIKSTPASPAIASVNPTLNFSSSSFDSPATNLVKVPGRVRRLPKRYEKEEIITPVPTVELKSTIYDNNVDESCLINRVPKLTVRVPKDLLDKPISSDEHSSDSEGSNRLTVDDSQEIIADEPDVDTNIQPVPPLVSKRLSSVEGGEEGSFRIATSVDDIVTAGDDIPLIELSLDRPLDKYPFKELIKLFLSVTIYNCIYCNHARKIAVNGEQLTLHMMAEHRFKATVDSITAEELLPEKITSRLKSGFTQLKNIFINMKSFDSEEKCEAEKFVNFDRLYECFQCYFTTPIHKDLYFHNRKMHQKTILLCIMCKSNFYTYSELLCHLCPGCYDSSYEAKFRCCLCHVDTIPSAFRLMVHLRKTHHACDVCLEICHNQSKLSNHVWKHKLHHLCYRCGIAYRNKTDISNHLFWKHGTESVLCKKCLQKKWSHIYHFCMPPTTFPCEECSQIFSKAIFLKVHKRFHTGEYKHECVDCIEKFVSKRLLEKHILTHRETPEEKKCTSPENILESHENCRVDPAPKIDNITPNEEKPLNLPEEIVDDEKSKKLKKTKKKELKDNLLMDVNLPALNLSESDSSDDTEIVANNKKNHDDQTPASIALSQVKLPDNDRIPEISEDVKAESEQVLGIWDNFKLYQAEVQKQKEPKFLVPIMKHVCESDHDYCIIPADALDDTILKNNDQEKMEYKSPDKRRKKHRSPRKKHTRPRSSGGSSSSSTSSDSDSHRSCGSNCSCSSSSGSSSSSSSSGSESSDSTDEKRTKDQFDMLQSKDSDASHNSAIDVTAMEEESPEPLLQEKKETIIAEFDLVTDETETDEDFYDERPQRLSVKVLSDNRNQLMLLAAVTPGTSRAGSPIVEKSVKTELSRKKAKTKKKKKLRTVSKHGLPPLKLNIPKQMLIQQTAEPIKPTLLVPNKITISLQSNTVNIPNLPPAALLSKPPSTTLEKDNKRASKRRRVPNKFYGYSSDEEFSLKPQLPPKLEWRKEDLPSPASSLPLAENKVIIAPPPLRQPTPEPVIPPPKPVDVTGRRRVDSVYSSDSDSSGEEGALQICQPIPKLNIRLPPPPVAITPQPARATTSALQYPLLRPAGFRQAREGESVYCYCRCPYDEVSEMIACDDDNCAIEWFHFECVGIMVPPKGKWYCPDCRLKYGNAAAISY